MPAGVSYGLYFRFTVAAMLSMLAGAQVVHMYYRPLDDMEELVEKNVAELHKQIVDEVSKKVT